MQYVKMGDFTISRLTLGTVQLGMDYGIANVKGKPDLAGSFDILSTAAAGGVNSFDTALLYGDSEIVIGSYLSSEACKLKEPVLTTKFKLVPGGEMDEAEVEKQIRGFAEESIRRLKIGRIPVYMLHNPGDMLAYGDSVSKTLERLKKEGAIEKAAVSVYTVGEAEEVLKNDIYEAIQIPMNIADRKMIESGVLEKLHNTNRIVFVRSVFLQGLFFMDPDMLGGNLKGAKEPIRKLAALAEREGMSIAQLALSYVRDIKGVSSLVIGAETAQQVRDNIELIEGPGISERARYETERLFDGISPEILNPGMWKI